jgi:FkbM family methyltransferase
MTLIYDVGLHDGRDTAHYLREGARVIAIDANPAMCAQAEQQFSAHIQTGQLTILNVGIAVERGSLKFSICHEHTEWSSFLREVASRNGCGHHSISIDCLSASDIINEYGVADYIKIDIEGHDRACTSARFYNEMVLFFTALGWP